MFLYGFKVSIGHCCIWARIGKEGLNALGRKCRLGSFSAESQKLNLWGGCGNGAYLFTVDLTGLEMRVGGVTW